MLFLTLRLDSTAHNAARNEEKNPKGSENDYQKAKWYWTAHFPLKSHLNLFSTFFSAPRQPTDSTTKLRKQLQGSLARKIEATMIDKALSANVSYEKKSSIYLNKKQRIFYDYLELLIAFCL